MTQYIPKDALVAEIESKRKCAQTLGDNAINSSMQQFYDGMKQGYVDILSSIDTLEVKEVDLKQLYREYVNNTYTEEFAQNILDGNIKGDLDNSDLFGIMSYGFELGLKAAQRGE